MKSYAVSGNAILTLTDRGTVNVDPFGPMTRAESVVKCAAHRIDYTHDDAMAVCAMLNLRASRDHVVKRAPPGFNAARYAHTDDRLSGPGEAITWQELRS